jgi:hypothetical protein
MLTLSFRRSRTKWQTREFRGCRHFLHVLGRGKPCGRSGDGENGDSSYGWVWSQVEIRPAPAEYDWVGEPPSLADGGTVRQQSERHPCEGGSGNTVTAAGTARNYPTPRFVAIDVGRVNELRPAAAVAAGLSAPG